MSTQIFINLPVRDLEAAKTFFRSLGYTFNEQFTDANAGCLEIAENIFAMLLVDKFFSTFTRRQIADPTTTETIMALSADSRATVDALVDKALAAGATVAMDPQDHGFMYTRSFYDLDGHHWEIFHLDPSAAPHG